MDKEYFTKRLAEIDATLQQLTANYNMIMGQKIEVQHSLQKLSEPEKQAAEDNQETQAA